MRYRQARSRGKGIAALHLYAQPPASDDGEIMGFLRHRGFAIGALAIPQRPMLALAFAFISVLALESTAMIVRRAPEGYEDESGFHFAAAVG